MNRSKIWSREFEGATGTRWYNWNPVLGCGNKKCTLHPVNKGECWAASICHRMASVWTENEIDYLHAKQLPEPEYHSPSKTKTFHNLEQFKPVFLESRFEKTFPGKPSQIMVGWMSDLSTVPTDWVKRIKSKISQNNFIRASENKPLHQFFFLTKWPEFYQKFYWPTNCWLGATFTSDLDYRMQMPHLSKAGECNPTFAMIEPYLKRIEKNNINEMVTGEYDQVLDDGKMKYTEINPVSWVVVGGGSTPVNPDWVRSIRDQCKAAKIPFHFKGWGWYLHASQSFRNDTHRAKSPHKIDINSMGYWKVGKSKSGNTLDGKTHLEGPEVT